MSAFVSNLVNSFLKFLCVSRLKVFEIWSGSSDICLADKDIAKERIIYD